MKTGLNQTKVMSNAKLANSH